MKRSYYCLINWYEKYFTWPGLVLTFG